MALLRKLWEASDFWDKQENKRQRDQFAAQAQQQTNPNNAPRRNIASRAFDQVNPFDNGRTFKQNATANTLSTIQQITHNGITNTAGNFVKPFAQTVNAAAVEPARATFAAATGNKAAYNAASKRGQTALDASLPAIAARTAVDVGTMPINLTKEAIGSATGNKIAEQNARNKYFQSLNRTPFGQVTSLAQNKAAEFQVRRDVPNVSKDVQAKLIAQNKQSVGLDPGASLGKQLVDTVSGAVTLYGGVTAPLAFTKSAIEGVSGVPRLSIPTSIPRPSPRLTPMNEVGSVRLPFTQGEPGANILKVNNPLGAKTGLKIKNLDDAKVTGLKISNPSGAKIKPLDVRNLTGGPVSTGQRLKITNKSGGPLVSDGLSGAAQQSWLSKAKNRLTLNEGGYVQIPGKKDPLDTLRQEARKYKSAEEFIDTDKTISVPIRDFPKTDTTSWNEALNNVSKGELSKTAGPVEVVLTPNGYKLVEGNHRAVQALQSGKDSIEAKIISKEGLEKIAQRDGPHIKMNMQDSLTRQQLTDLYNQANKPSLKDKLGISSLGEDGFVQLPGRKADKVPENTPAGFISAETKPRNGMKDTVRIKVGDKGLERTIQSEPALIPEKMTVPKGEMSPPLTQDIPGSVRAENTLDLKSKPAKATFMEATNRHLGAKAAANTQNTVIARSLPKLDDTQSLGLVDSIQTGIQDGSFADAPAQVRGILDAKYKQLVDAGVDIGYLQDYFPQKWKNATQADVNKAYEVLNLRAGIQNPRTIPSVKEGIQMGFQPVATDYRQAIANYLDTADRLLANKQYFSELKAKGLIAEAGSRPQGMQLIDAPGLPQPRPFVDPETGNQIQGAYYAKPDVAKQLNKMFGDQTPHGGFEKTLNKTAKASSTLQDFGLSGGVPGTPVNAFTIAQGTKEILSGNFKSPFVATMKSFTAKGADKYFAKHADDIAEMQSRGIPVRSGFSVDAKTLAKDFSEATGIKGKAIQVWQHAFNDPTFQRFMPVLQTEMYSKVKAKYGADVAAKAVKNFYGITDMATQATRSKAGNDFVTTALFAPKYRESMVNFWKENAKALANPTDPAYRANLKFVVGAAMSYAALDYVNQQFNNGDHLWDNPDGKKDKALTATIGGKQVGIPFLSSIATVPRNTVSLGANLLTGNLEQAKKDAGSFLGYGIKPIADLVNNENYFGGQITKEGDSAGQRLKDIGTYLAGAYNHPYIREGINTVTGKNTSGIETASKASELPFRFYDTSAYKYGGQGLTKDQKEQYRDLPSDQRKQFLQSTIGDNKVTSKANKEKQSFKAANGDSKTLSTGEVYGKIGNKYVTKASQKEFDQAKFEDAFKKSSKKTDTFGDTVYQKRKDGTVFKKNKFEYEYDKSASARKLQMDRASEANDLKSYVKYADEEYNALESLKQQYDPETEQDKIDALTLKQENLSDKVDGYLEKGYIRKGRGGKGKKINMDLLSQAKVIDAPKIRKSSLSVKKPSIPKMGGVKTPRVASRPRNRGNVTSTKTRIS